MGGSHGESQGSGYKGLPTWGPLGCIGLYQNHPRENPSTEDTQMTWIRVADLCVHSLEQAGS
jgi:hypothetical protein